MLLNKVIPLNVFVGAKGERGFPGAKGVCVKGERGLPGARGVMGFTGATGSKGQKGLVNCV